MQPAQRPAQTLRPESAMRFRSRYALLAAAALSVGCQTNTTTNVGPPPPAPQHLTYQLEQSGDPISPAGILLSWDDVQDSSLAYYNVYSSASLSGSFGLRGVTTSNTFHDNGVPHLRYFVTAVDLKGLESVATHSGTVSRPPQITAPSSPPGIPAARAGHLDLQGTPGCSRLQWGPVETMRIDPSS